MNENLGIQTQPSGKYLTFVVSNERYGIEILNVQEIIKITQITVVPKSPKFIKGVINLRGKIIPVIDLRLKFGIDSIPYGDRTCIIVVNLVSKDERVVVGIVVDTVLEVINFLQSEIHPPPKYGERFDAKFIIGMGRRDEHVNILIDIEKILEDVSLDVGHN